MTGADLPRTAWRKSSRSGSHNNCVEVATNLPRVAVRDSKNPNGPKLGFNRRGWRGFAASAKAGAFDQA